MSKLLIVIPAHNEEANIVQVVEELTRSYPQYDYVVVNDGSRDKTAALCRAHGYRLIDLPVNLGLAGAFQTGLRFAAENGYDCAMQMDADGQHKPEYIAPMLAALEEGRAPASTPAPGTTAAPAASATPTATPAPQMGGAVSLASLERLNTEVFLRRSSRSGHVTRLQRALRAMGFFTESATGYFGSATEEAVIAYQKARGQAADGMAGRATLTAINKDIAGGGVSASID